MPRTGGIEGDKKWLLKSMGFLWGNDENVSKLTLVMVV